ncbi:membrane protein insertion efficiency factor YidD [Dapis sp. BLCC M229]|uniref:membrane protein insertion efficiency factor YidD n=1 Tax=Dapis sp. BLCC M229 TaxID=3400188 RepID=UPI003CF8D981
MNKIAVALISGYQQYISPRKGFSCAHRILYGDESCSHYIKRMFIEQDFSGAITAANQRFKACKEANQILKLGAISNSENEEDFDLKDKENLVKNKPPKLKLKDNYKRKSNCSRVRKNIDCCSYEILECDDCFPELECGSCNLDCSPDCGSCGG